MIDYRPVTTGFGEPSRGAPVQRDVLYLREARAFAAALLPDQHAARVESLGNGVAGVMRAGKVAIHAIGAAYARLKGTKMKSGIEQVDRLLSNEKVDLGEVFRAWSPCRSSHGASATTRSTLVALSGLATIYGNVSHV